MPTCFAITLQFLMQICFCHQKGGLSYLTDESPDVLCIQETKCATEDIPGDVKVDGYHDYWSSAEKAGYAGTAIYSKTKPLNVTYGLGMKAGSSWGISRHHQALVFTVFIWFCFCYKCVAVHLVILFVQYQIKDFLISSSQALYYKK